MADLQRVPPHEGHCLELSAEAHPPRYALNGQILQPGDAIEVRLADGAWLPGTFDWNGNPTRWPAVRVVLAGHGGVPGRPNTGVMALQPGSILRRRAS